MTIEQTVRVTSIRSQNPRGFGGCIFSAKPIDDLGRVQNTTSYFVVKVSAAALGGSQVKPGQWWKVSGEPLKRLLQVNGYRVQEIQIDASRAVMARPAGEQIIAFMADNPAFEGIGNVKAHKLWQTFGEQLYEHLDDANFGALATILTSARAAQVVAAWSQNDSSRTLHWLETNGVNLVIGRKVLQFFGPQTTQKLWEDPYRLLSFCATWRQTDTLARTHFGVAIDDPRRLKGAIEEACYRALAMGHTTTVTSMLLNLIQSVLGAQTNTFRWRRLILETLAQGLSNGGFVVGLHGVQSLGAMVMEQQVARVIADRLSATLPPLLSSESINEMLLAYETTEGIELNPQQREAVHLAAAKPFVIITGGAAFGKTTVLNALHHIYDQAGIAVTQLALAGNATKRMQEITGRPSMTIANFMCSLHEGILGDSRAVIVDDASMIDIITMGRLCEVLGSLPRLVLVGDTDQLMPVGPGSVLHTLTKVHQVPVAQLSVVEPYGGAVAAAAASILHGRWPEVLADSNAPIGFIPCSSRLSTTARASIPETVLKLYKQDPSNTQVLCVRSSGVDGTATINALCQLELTADAEAVEVWDEQHEAYSRLGFHLGDPVVCTRNHFHLGLRNGSFGVIVQVGCYADMSNLKESDTADLALAWIDWDDGVRRPLFKEMLEDIKLSYAITVHKSQGTQWPRVILPLSGHQPLDRSMIYAAVTRAKNQLLIVGDLIAAKAAVEGLPRPVLRRVQLDLWLATFLERR